MSVSVRPYGKGQGGWQVDVRVRFADGSRHRDRKRITASKSAALRWGQDRERHLLQFGLPAPRKEVPTLADFAPRFVEEYARANKQKPSGIAWKQTVLRIHLLPRLSHKRLDEIANTDVQGLKQSMSGLSAKTVNNALTVLNTLLKRAVEWQVIEQLPCRIGMLSVAPTQAGFHDFEAYGALTRTANSMGTLCHVVILLGGDAGLRCGEMIALHWDDVDFENQRLRVSRSDWNGQLTSPKGGRGRYIPMTRALMGALEAHKHRRSVRVLCRPDATAFTRQQLQSQVKQIARTAGVKAGVHILRHTFCSHLAMRGAPARSIQALAGHSELNTTQRYMHLTPDALDVAIALLNGRRGNNGATLARSGEDVEKV